MLKRVVEPPTTRFEVCPVVRGIEFPRTLVSRASALSAMLCRGPCDVLGVLTKPLS